MKQKREDYVGYALMLIALYVMTSGMVYRFRNPCLTETQLFLKIPQAILFSSERQCPPNT